MKRKLLLLTAIILSLSLLLTACGQKDISEAKAKEIGLAYINQIFDVNETEATVYQYMEECLPENDGAVVTGDPNIGTRIVYTVRVAKRESLWQYQAGVIASSGMPYFAQRNEINLVMTDEQKEMANNLFTEERNWGEKHEAALAELKEESKQFVRETYNPKSDILLSASMGDYRSGTLTTTFIESFYVVLRDGTIYFVRMQWPSMQVLSIAVEHSS